MGQRLQCRSPYWICYDNAIKCHQLGKSCIYHARASVTSNDTWLLVLRSDFPASVQVCVSVWVWEREREQLLMWKKNGPRSRGCGRRVKLLSDSFTLSNPEAQCGWTVRDVFSPCRPHLGGMKMSCCDYRLHDTAMSVAALLESGLTFDARGCKGPSKPRGLYWSSTGSRLEGIMTDGHNEANQMTYVHLEISHFCYIPAKLQTNASQETTGAFLALTSRLCFRFSVG